MQVRKLTSLPGNGRTTRATQVLINGWCDEGTDTHRCHSNADCILEFPEACTHKIARSHALWYPVFFCSIDFVRWSKLFAFEFHLRLLDDPHSASRSGQCHSVSVRHIRQASLYLRLLWTCTIRLWIQRHYCRIAHPPDPPEFWTFWHDRLNPGPCTLRIRFLKNKRS